MVKARKRCSWTRDVHSDTQTHRKAEMLTIVVCSSILWGSLVVFSFFSQLHHFLSLRYESTIRHMSKTSPAKQGQDSSAKPAVALEHSPVTLSK